MDPVTNKTGIKDVLSPDDRRELVLRGLAGEPRQHLADAYGVSLRAAKMHLRKARDLTGADIAEASKELEFRRRVLEILNGKQTPQDWPGSPDTAGAVR